MERLADIFKTKQPRTLLLLAAIDLLLAYVFTSLAIDSGNIFEWLLGSFFAAWAIVELGRATRYSLNR